MFGIVGKEQDDAVECISNLFEIIKRFIALMMNCII